MHTRIYIYIYIHIYIYTHICTHTYVGMDIDNQEVAYLLPISLQCHSPLIERTPHFPIKKHFVPVRSNVIITHKHLFIVICSVAIAERLSDFILGLISCELYIGFLGLINKMASPRCLVTCHTLQIVGQINLHKIGTHYLSFRCRFSCRRNKVFMGRRITRIRVRLVEYS
jgi:hypothetical protein